MKNLVNILIVSMSLLVMRTGRMYAQEKETTYPKFILSTKPFLLFDGEYKINFEMPLKSPQDWVGIGLSGFYLPEKHNRTWSTRNTINYGDELFGLKGAGVDLTYKHFFLPRMVYVGGDLSYGYYQTKVEDFILRPFEENGLTLYEYTYGKTTKDFNRIASQVYVGISSSIQKMIFVDAYLGVGYTHGFYKDDTPRFDSLFGFGYKGVYPVLGLRVGIAFGR
ncbi:MAG: hypothetical protein PHG27_03165 [Massilibacteroides sp.]|nr:hypothetical protein [Massilibacteroides sp.]MDD3064164.1 hypothetical protein [Massilibacteroides sp.]MDD4114588.1 hypothetical protein [Massilibacteroides sp.]MDD4660786.1 hypothetical protein [Massilibacteroides sp.]